MTDSLLRDLERIRAARRAARPKYFRRSRLDPYRPQIEKLAWAGARLEDIRLWLRQRVRLDVNRSTISRALKRWKTFESRTPDGTPG
jgi:hypothetical protein